MKQVAAARSPAWAAWGAPHLQALAGIFLDGKDEQLRMVLSFQLVPSRLHPLQQKVQTVWLPKVQGAVQVFNPHL